MCTSTVILDVDLRLLGMEMERHQASAFLFLVFDIHLRSADCLDQQQKMEDLMSYVFFNIKGFI